MYLGEYSGINSFLVGTCKLLVSEGKNRQTRDQNCVELPEPYMFKISNPCARHINIPIRKWNKTLPYAESLWIASGRNDLQFINHYLPRMNEYSDDNVTVRGGYGPRIRHFDNQIIDYDCREFTAETKTQVDQFRYVVECFKKDINTRRAIITIGDPIKDCFGDNRELKCTKDFPCTRTLQFIKQADSNKLNLIVTMRSNDLIYGASAVNVFNYTFMQEYFAAILGLEVGTYIHIANNMHYYDSHDDLVHRLATLDTADDFGEPISKTFKSLEEFDNMLYMLLKEETKMRQEGLNYKPIDFYDPFFDNWYKVLWKWNLKHSS